LEKKKYSLEDWRMVILKIMDYGKDIIDEINKKL
jgi:hypothetical protein